MTTNLFVYFDVLPPLSWTDTVVMCLPAVSLFTAQLLRDDLRRRASSCAGGATGAGGDGVGRVLQARIGADGVRVCDWRILPSTTCGRYTGAPLMWFFVSAPVSVTFAAGATAVVSTLAIFTISALGP